MRKFIIKIISVFLIISFWECSKTLYQFTKGYLNYKPKTYIKDVKDVYEKPESYMYNIK